MARWRIWSEFLPPTALAAPATVRLLERYSLEPLVALSPAAETGAMAEALGALGRVGLPVGLWPLLSDEQGYWPSENNARAFRRRVEQALAFAGRAGVRLATVAVDLEPPLAMIHSVRAGSARERGHLFVDALRERRGSECAAVREQAVRHFAELAGELRSAGLETIAAVLPPIIVDLRAQTTLWQDVLRTPVVQRAVQRAGARGQRRGDEAAEPLWSVLSPMAYTSMLTARLPRALRAHAHVLVYEMARALVRSAGRGQFRPGISLGVLGTGKLGDEGVMATPRDLAADVASARAAGIDDLALFSLEGLLGRAQPEAWLEALTRTPAQAPSGWSARALSTAMRGIGLGALGVAHVLG